MRKLLMIVAAFLAFKGARGVRRPPTPQNGRRPDEGKFSLGALFGILFAPRWLRLPLLVKMLFTSREPAPVRVTRRR